MIELNIIPTFKELLRAETFNSEGGKAYFQQFDVKIMIAFHKQAMMKQKIYKNILARKSGMYYSPWMYFESRLVNMDQEKAITNNNQLKN